MGKSKKSKTNVTASSKQTVKDQEKLRFEAAQQILDTPNVVTCVKKAEELVVKIVVSEESIAKLLGMEFQQGKRIKNVDANVPGMKNLVNKAIYDNWSLERTKYGIKDLKPIMKIWQKIFIYCLHPRTGGTDYLNATQKVIMYYISKGEPICLPFLLFNYLKECVEKSRTTATENKRSISYIPYGRLLSDIFIQNKLVKTLSDLGLHEDLTMTIGDALNGTKLKRMQIIEKVQVEPTEDTSEEVRQKNYPVDDYPLWSKKDNPASILEYVRMPRSNGDKITLEEFVRTLPNSPPTMPTRRAKKTTSKPSDQSSTERTSEESSEEYQSNSSMDSSSGTQEEEVPARKNVKRKAIIEESSDEETEDDVPLVKRKGFKQLKLKKKLSRMTVRSLKMCSKS
ncbi:uncharacterized protein LOC130736408 [Lotus japonicus]|uniref:uncharacterized protein LOC130736408 n=1 Tax=Lotus japonicus TaxID=34305 RepID=UPI002588539A|nr:uncharacterized protein LOC130736408 [Lotus japonicus]